ncbi:hypothetical protein W02_40560 [Nitrospira sp. KM1]|nr:hypothetical protein W02_40560 [Nitrospira sp. KM1]
MSEAKEEFIDDLIGAHRTGYLRDPRIRGPFADKVPFVEVSNLRGSISSREGRYMEKVWLRDHCAHCRVHIMIDEFMFHMGVKDRSKIGAVFSHGGFLLRAD